jgi:hypothetical protein
MNERAIDLGKVTALSVLSAGLAFCSLNVRAQEQQQVAALEMPRPRAAAPVMTIGGLKPGQVMVIGAGTPEVMSATAFAQRPIMTPAMKAAESCLLK